MKPKPIAEAPIKGEKSERIYFLVPYEWVPYRDTSYLKTRHGLQGRWMPTGNVASHYIEDPFKPDEKDKVRMPQDTWDSMGIAKDPKALEYTPTKEYASKQYYGR